MNTNQQTTVELLKNTLEHERKNSDPKAFKEFLGELADVVEAEQKAGKKPADKGGDKGSDKGE